MRQPGKNCMPESLLDGEIPAYDDFLEQRRKLMAQKKNLVWVPLVEFSLNRWRSLGGKTRISYLDPCLYLRKCQLPNVIESLHFPPLAATVRARAQHYR